MEGGGGGCNSEVFVKVGDLGMSWSFDDLKLKIGSLVYFH